MPEISASAAPDWEAITHDVLCPLCEYNLRGLRDARCPECGYRFAWGDVIDPKTRVHPYLFEHHPERNFRSFFHTLWGTLRPQKFWPAVSPMQPSRPRRLARYWIFSSMLVLLALIGQWTLAIVELWNFDIWGLNPPYSPNGWPPSRAFSLDHFWRVAKDAWEFNSGLDEVFYLCLFWLIWPWLTLLVLLIFRASIRRAKVKTFHINRCLVYSFDIGAWFGFIVGAACVLSIGVRLIDFDARGLACNALEGLVVLIVIVRLWLAYRLYLRFDHAFWVILASQVIVFLMLFNLMLVRIHIRGPRYLGLPQF